MVIKDLLLEAAQKNASDIHLSAGLAPVMRIDGDLQYLDHPVLTQESAKELILSMMTERQKKTFIDKLELDFAIEQEGAGRFRVNAFNQARGVAAVLRLIPETVLTLEQLSMPPSLKKLAEYPHGLVLVTGPTGSGKSTTLAAVIDIINSGSPDHIITIEDPIEFVHKSKKCVVNQREVGKDTESFNMALRSALREDPDVILVGEMRDLETIRLALTAAETGHLVFATLHTSSASKTINRIIDVFPAEEKSLVRSMLSEALQAVVCQTLLKKNGGGRIAALEIMTCTPAIRNLIREDKSAQIYSSIQTGGQYGMQTLDQHLAQLQSQNLISAATANEVAAQKTVK